MELKLKQQFLDWESCEKNHFEYCNKNFSPILSKYQHATTVESHNKTACKRAAKGVHTPLDEKLKYAKVQMVCVHYGKYESKGKGHRKSSTFTNSCPAHVTYSASSKVQALYISSLDLVHNHDIGPELYEKYPANRALRQGSVEQSAKVTDFIRVRGDNKLVLEEIRKDTGRYEKPKSLQNFKLKQSLKDKESGKRDSAQKLLLQLQKDQKDDPDMVVSVSIESSSKFLEFVFWQTGRMREVFNKYPEHLLCDATFCLNRCGMPLYIIMVVDGNLQSEIVGLCLAKNGKKDYVQKLFEAFQAHNENWKNTRSIMVDKDLGEISVLRELFSHADIEICLFHVLKAIKAKISSLRMTTAASLAARTHAQKIAYSYRENTFRDNVEAMLADEELANYPEFQKYMQENWVSIKEMWVQAYRRQHFNLGEATNNRLESYNQKIKGICKRNAALDDLYNDLKIFCSYVETLNDHEKFEAKTKNTFSRHTFENEEVRDIAQNIHDKVVPAFAGTIVQNLLKSLTCKISCTPVDNCDSFIIKIDNHPEVIASDIKCSCSTFVTKEIPCSHIFIARKHLEKTLFTDEILSKRLSKSFWVEGLNSKSVHNKRVLFQTRHPAKPQKCKTSQEKYREAMPILETLGNVLSSCGQETFKRRIKIINKIASSWAERKEVKLMIGNEEYDPDLEDSERKKMERGLKRKNRLEEQSEDESRKSDESDENDDEGNDNDEESFSSIDSGENPSNEGHDDDEEDDKYQENKGKERGDEESDSSVANEEKDDAMESDVRHANEDNDSGDVENSVIEETDEEEYQLKGLRGFINDGKHNVESKADLKGCLTLPEVKEPLKLSVVGRPKGIFQTVIGLKRNRLRRKVQGNVENSPKRAKNNRHSLTPVKIQNEDYPDTPQDVQEMDVWLSKPMTLTKEHKMGILSRTYMHCEVMDAAQLILKTQFKNVTAGLNSLFRTNIDYGKHRIPFIQNTVPNEGYFVQIYNIEKHLICCAGFYNEEDANISIYDSLKYLSLEQRCSRLPQLVSLLSAQFKNTNVEKLHLKFIKVTDQEEVECGAHAVANAVNACLHAEPGCIIYNTSKNTMRKHLHDCLEKNHLSSFPIKEKNPGTLKVYYESTRNLVYCICRKEYDGSKMIQCDRCSEWFHQTCVNDSKKHPKKGYEWLCEFRCAPDTIELP